MPSNSCQRRYYNITASNGDTSQARTAVAPGPKAVAHKHKFAHIDKVAGIDELRRLRVFIDVVVVIVVVCCCCCCRCCCCGCCCCCLHLLLVFLFLQLFWALMSPHGSPHEPSWGAHPNWGPSWAGLKFGPSWAYGGPKLGPIMGGTQVWAIMGP